MNELKKAGPVHDFGHRFGTALLRILPAKIVSFYEDMGRTSSETTT